MKNWWLGKIEAKSAQHNKLTRSQALLITKWTDEYPRKINYRVEAKSIPTG
ncbi:hypothetical protein [Nostoc sp.]|uniref:hypothetical protein n=1 Tax=Nostoc sp. TaxID=1180 RepID=UPI002FFB32C5